MVVTAASNYGGCVLEKGRESKGKSGEMGRDWIQSVEEDVGSEVSRDSAGGSGSLRKVKKERKKKGWLMGRKKDRESEKSIGKDSLLDRGCYDGDTTVDGSVDGGGGGGEDEVVKGVYSGDGEFMRTEEGLVQVGNVGDEVEVSEDGDEFEDVKGTGLGEDYEEESDEIGGLRRIETEGSVKTFKPYRFTAPGVEASHGSVPRDASMISEDEDDEDDEDQGDSEEEEDGVHRNFARASIGTISEPVKIAEGVYRMQRKENNATSLPRSNRVKKGVPVQSSLKRHDSNSSTGSGAGAKKTVSFRDENTIINDVLPTPSPPKKRTPTKKAKIVRKDGGVDVSPIGVKTTPRNSILLSSKKTARHHQPSRPSVSFSDHQPSRPSVSFSDRPPASVSPPRRQNSIMSSQNSMKSREEIEAARVASTRRQSMAVRDAMTQQIRGIPRSAMLAYEENSFTELKMDRGQDASTLTTPMRSSMHVSSSVLRPRARSSRKSMRPPPNVMRGMVPPPPPPPPFTPKRLRVKSVRATPPPPAPMAV